MERVKRPSWLAVVVLAGFVGVAALLGTVLMLVGSRWSDAGTGVLVALASYWFAAGAWLRTPWGRVETRNPPPAPPELTARHAELYVVAGVLCVVACVVALGLQALAADL